MPAAHPRCEIVPMPGHHVAFLVDGEERFGWNIDPSYPRPFFFPLRGPASGRPLTRIGHPGAPDHDHHLSIWFAHHKVLGIDFWGYRSSAYIRQHQWLAYQDGDTEAIMACNLAWYDGHDPKELLTQELIAVLRPMPDNETLVEVQATFRPVANSLEFGQTNFGFFAVRVAKSISAHFGGGKLTNSQGATGEAAIFGQAARWMDYGGTGQPPGKGEEPVREGITYFDHVSNPGYPSHWHVREDGWMCASPCMNRPLVTTQEQPLTLRYMLHAHRGVLDVTRADRLAEEFNSRPSYVVRKSTRKHEHFAVETAE